MLSIHEPLRVNVFLADEAATDEFARQLLRGLPNNMSGWILLLSGELGAGKSTFARAFIRAAGHDGTVPSPTYTLVEPYQVPRGTIYHIDLYRITGEDELQFLGWHEQDDGLRLVEWPERVPAIAGQSDIALTLAYEGTGRRAVLSGLSPRGEALIRDLEQG